MFFFKGLEDTFSNSTVNTESYATVFSGHQNYEIWYNRSCLQIGTIQTINDPTWVIYIWIPSFSLKESGLLKTVEIDVEGGGWESLIKQFHFEASFF